MAYYKEAVEKYHKKLRTIKFRVLQEDAEAGIPDYAAIIKAQAESYDKSVNEYIMDLIEDDIRENSLEPGHENFHFIRSAAKKD